MINIKPFVEAPGLEAEILEALKRGDPESAIRLMIRGVWSFYCNEELLGKALYLRGLDYLIEKIGALLADPELSSQAVTGGTIIVATEYYEVGGHTRVAGDLCRSLATRGGVVSVLTDTFSSYSDKRLSAESVIQRMGGTEQVFLDGSSIVGKVKRLQELFRSIKPARVLFLNHHHDPVALIAAASLPKNCRRFFLHHGDHMPSLGCTLNGYAHVDFTIQSLESCSRFLAGPHYHLPLYAEDFGAKDFQPLSSKPLSVVSSGPGKKYVFAGELAYPKVIAEVLQFIGGSYFHIGELSSDEQQQIATVLQNQRIAHDRFIHITQVESLWQAVHKLPAHIYLSSFPIGGGRTAVEVQGCAYPTIHGAAPQGSPLLSAQDIYAEPGLVWRTIDELKRHLSVVAAQHDAYSMRARQHYVNRHSLAAFENSLDRIFLETAGE